MVRLSVYVRLVADDEGGASQTALIIKPMNTRTKTKVEIRLTG